MTPKRFSFGDELGTVGQCQLGTSGGGSAPTPASVSLRLADLPPGWADKGPSSDHGSHGPNGCPGVRTSKTTGDVHSDNFQSGDGLQDASSDGSVAPSANAARHDLTILRAAKSLTCVKQRAAQGLGAGSAITSVQHLSFSGPGVPSQSTGYRFALKVKSRGNAIPAVWIPLFSPLAGLKPESSSSGWKAPCRRHWKIVPWPGWPPADRSVDELVVTGLNDSAGPARGT